MTEKEIREKFNIPDCYYMHRAKNLVFFSFCDSTITVNLDIPSATECHMGLDDSGHYFAEKEWK